jgi:hypothetical protein
MLDAQGQTLREVRVSVVVGPGATPDATPAPAQLPVDVDLRDGFLALVTANGGPLGVAGLDAIGDFSPDGVLRRVVTKVDGSFRYLTIDPATKRLFASNGHYAVAEIAANGAATELKPPFEISWPSGIAFDTQRRRVSVASFGGAGALDAFDPATSTWSNVASLNNVDLGAMAYDPATDRFYALGQGFGGSTLGTLYVVAPTTGAVTQLSLSPAIETYGSEGNQQLVPFQGELIAVLHDPGVAKPRIAHIDPATGKVSGAARDLDFPPSKNVAGVCDGDAKPSDYWQTSAAIAAQAQELHVVGVYEGLGPSSSGTSHPTQHVAVDVAASTKPMVIYLSAYEPIEWQLKVAAGAQVAKVIATGYYAGTVTGAPMGAVIETPSWVDCAYGWEPERNTGGCSYKTLIAAARARTGLTESSYFGCYTGKAFTVPPPP